MQPLTPDDLLPFDEFAERRVEFLHQHLRYLDRYRRVRVGPRAAFVFENRQTLWFRVQDVLRVARVGEPEWVRRELTWSNRLLPRKGQFQAALVVQPGEPEFGGDLAGEAVVFTVGELPLPARLVTCRPEDRCAGNAFWVEFTVPDAGRALLADFRRPARLALRHPEYAHETPLNEDVRQSLLDDLAASDRDAA